MAHRKTGPTEDAAPKPAEGPRPEDAAPAPSGEALPQAGAESVPAPAEPADLPAVEPVTVDATADPIAPEPEPVQEPASEPEPQVEPYVEPQVEPHVEPQVEPHVEARAEPVYAAAPAAPEPEPVAEEEHHEEEGGRSFAAWALGLLLALIAGAGLGIWAAPRVAPKLPAGMAPVAAWLTPGREEAAAEIAALKGQLDQGLGGVEARIAELSSAGDVDARIKAAVDASAAQLSGSIGTLQQSVDQLGGPDTAQRVARLEQALQGQAAELATLKDQLSGTTAASGQLSAEAAQKIDVYRAELDGLRAELGQVRDQVAGLGSRVDEVAANADRQIATAQSKVTEVQTQASTALSAAAAQSDLALMRAAIAGGQPFAEPLAALAGQPGVTVPPEMEAAAQSGVASMAELRDSYADAAHAAIQASILAGAGPGVLDRSRAFLQAQVASRSLTPTAGVGTDAVLSRMEDKLRHDDLAGALAESAQLPSEAAAAMAGWLGAARARAAALDGLAGLETAVPATN